MEASAIAISSDSSDENTSTIAPVISPTAPVVETTLVASPTGLYGLIPYSDFNSDSPDEMFSLEHISQLPAILPFLCTDSSEAPESSNGSPSQDPYVATVAHWRSRVTSCPSSSSFEFPIAPVTAPPRIHRWSAILIRPGEAIPFGRPYRTHLNGLRKLLNAKKRVGPLPASRLAWRHASPRSLDHHSSSLVHLRIFCQFILRVWMHQIRLILDLRLKMYHLDWVTLRGEHHDEDTKIDPIETKVDMELGISDGDDVRDHVEIDPRDFRDDTEEYKADTSAGDTIEVGIDPMLALIVEEEIIESAGEDSSNLFGTRDGIVRSYEDMLIDLDDTVRDFYHHMSEVRIDRIVGIEIVQRRLEADQLIARGQRVSMIERIDSLRLENLKVCAMLDIERDRVNNLCLHITMTNTRTGMTLSAIEEMINQHVDAALEARRVNRDLKLGNGNDNGDGNGNGNGDGNGNGTRNRNNRGDNGDGNENHNVNRRGDRPVAHECTYQDFMKCQPLGFKGTEGVVGLIRWSEKMETVFHISNYSERYQVKYATCTLLDSALTWWNSHKRTIRTDAAYTLS
ncbi:hypothetical protein Tco_1388140 [Tanacetum coccineum]